ncbi:biotin transporter BioY [Nocardiopsis changdeensis]|uniref:Biotin transporter n=1 Tax=Nocardiopsis changdeensis TaxID=2831969 RepID=A0ABX8BLE0_9ACTN|nr:MULTISPECIES: biotin transporter BioY [Nocardiopsis]QUX21613.1 biotin transporter BioY [Nocardiopsis changdeensis]QYX37548.1 biotin transporter BioY [Nocardiopsis sp. MT53]
MPTTRTAGIRYRGLTARDLALIAVFAAFIAVLSISGQITVPLSPVPITLQTLGIMLAPALLGWKRGTLAVAVFLVLGLAGLPLFAGGAGGLGVLAGPSAGFIVSWIPAALVIGFLTDLMVRGGRYRFWAGLAVNVLGGVLVVYAVGVPWLGVAMGNDHLAALVAMVAYLPGDLAKAVIASLIAAAVYRAYPIPPAGRPVIEEAGTGDKGDGAARGEGA